MSEVKLIGLTGATGLIGAKFLEQLALNYPQIRIRCLSRKLPVDRFGDNVEWLQGDLLSEADCAEFVDGLDAIGHFGQSNSPAISDRHWPSDLAGNMTATLNLIEALRNRGDRTCHLVFSSSGGAVYGDTAPSSTGFTESDPCAPLSPYGIQKLAIENYLYLASRQGWMTVTVLRISNVYGTILASERRQGLIGVAMARLLEGKPIQVFGSPTTVRDYVHLDDVARSALLAIFLRDPFQVFNIGSGVGYSVSEVLDNVFKITGKTVPIETSNFGKRSFDLTPKVVLCREKARRELLWEPRISMEEGIHRLWETVKKNHVL